MNMFFTGLYLAITTLLYSAGGYSTAPTQKSEISPASAETADTLHCLLIGDSNGAFPYGWASQLADMRPKDRFCNTCKAGNTIGFDNNERPELNTLRMLDSYIDRGLNEMGHIDLVIIMLGTNDCKAIFADSLALVPDRMYRLLEEIRNDSRFGSVPPHLYMLSPPPIGADSIMQEKYHGAAERILWLLPELERTAERSSCTFLATWQDLYERWPELSSDGIHMTPEGQKKVAKIISSAMDRTSHR